MGLQPQKYRLSLLHSFCVEQSHKNDPCIFVAKGSNEFNLRMLFFFSSSSQTVNNKWNKYYGTVLNHLYCVYWLQFYSEKKKRKSFCKSVVTTESFLLIKSNWQQLQRRIIIHRTICQENTTYWHTLEKKCLRTKIGNYYMFQREGLFLFSYLS